MAGTFCVCDKTAEVSWRFNADGVPMENVFHFTGTAEWTATLLGSLLTYMQSWENASAVGLRNTCTVCTGGYAVDLSSRTGPYAQLSTSIEGTAAGACLPHHATIAIKAGTALRGRAFRGRSYWIGLSDSQLAAGGQMVGSTPLTAIVAAMEALRTGAIPNSGVMAVRHCRVGNVEQSVGVMTPITGWVAVDAFVDSQRRRLIAHNIHR